MIKTRLINLLGNSKRYIALSILWQWIALLGQITAVFTLASLLQKMLDGTLQIIHIRQGALVISGVLLLRFICDKQASKAAFNASVDVKHCLRENIYCKLLRLGSAYKEQTTTSEIVQMAGEGVEQLEIYFGRYLPQLFYSLLAPLTLFIMLSFISLKASLVLLICVPLIPVSIIAVQRFAKKLLSRYWGIYTELGDSFLENLQGLTTLKIYQSDQKRAEAMDQEAEQFRRITMKVLTMQLNSISVMDVVAYGGAAIGMAVALGDYFSGQLNLAGTLIILLLAAEFFIPLRLLGSFFHIAMNGMAASDKIFKLLDLPEPKQGSVTALDQQADIVLKNVHFAYEKEREILKGISLTLPSGSFTALVGGSGSGKSTIASLLMGRNKSYTGTIKIGNTRLSAIEEAVLMRQITMVSHNSYLFKGTVRDNLTMGNPDASDEDMKDVLRKVNLFDFLEAQEGLDTPVAEKGSNLSGGQCQRLALARALLHDSPVYIFDEATSNIDTESEEKIMEVIHELAKTRTVLLISHRLANVVASDKIFVLDDGRITEEGTHAELLAQKGKYSELYQYQQALERYTVVKSENEEEVA